MKFLNNTKLSKYEKIELGKFKKNQRQIASVLIVRKMPNKLKIENYVSKAVAKNGIKDANNRGGKKNQI